MRLSLPPQQIFVLTTVIAYQNRNLACSCFWKLSLKVNVTHCGAKSSSLPEDCYGGEWQPWWMQCLQRRSQHCCHLLAFSSGCIFGQSKKNAQMCILFLIWCVWGGGFLTHCILACSMVWNKRTGCGGKNPVRSVSQSHTPAVAHKTVASRSLKLSNLMSTYGNVFVFGSLMN